MYVAGGNVEAQSPLDSALVPENSTSTAPDEGSSGSNSSSSTKRPGENDAGEYIHQRIYNLCVLLYFTYVKALTNHHVTAPPKKKRKTSNAEKAMDKAFSTFMKYQRESEERFQQLREEQWKNEKEIEERRRREDKEHELRIIQMLGQGFNNYNYSTPPHQYDFDY